MKDTEALTQEQLRLGRLRYAPIDYLAKLKEGLTESEFAEKYRLLKYRCPKGCSLGAVYETPLGRIITNRGLLYALPLTPQARLIAEYLGNYKRALYTLQSSNIKDEEAENSKFLIASKYPLLLVREHLEAERRAEYTEGDNPGPPLRSTLSHADDVLERFEAALRARRLHTESAVMWLEEFFVAGQWLCAAHSLDISWSHGDISDDLEHAKQTRQKTNILETSHSGKQLGRINSSVKRGWSQDVEKSTYLRECLLALEGVSSGVRAVRAKALRRANEKRARTTDTDVT